MKNFHTRSQARAFDCRKVSVSLAALLSAGLVFGPGVRAADLLPQSASLNGGTDWTCTTGAGTTTCSSTNGGAVTVKPDETITVEFEVTIPAMGGGNWRSTQALYSIQNPCGEFEPDHTAAGTFTESFNVVVSAPDGTYDLVLLARNADNCTGTAEGTMTLVNAITVVTNEACCIPGSIAPPMCVNVNPATCSGTVVPGATCSGMDSDGDGLDDTCDPCPNDDDNDKDGDGLCCDEELTGCCNDPDNDKDGDGLCCDGADPCCNDPDNDKDGDGICGNVDPCPNDPDNDKDHDGRCCDVTRGGPFPSGDICCNDPDNDKDGDGICGDVDDCPNDRDNDKDGDGLCGDVDKCPNLSPNTGACCDGTTGTCMDVGSPTACPVNPKDPQNQFRFENCVLCAELEPPCAEHTGACCDGNTGLCMDDIPESACPTDDPQFTWTKDLLCENLDPPCREHTGACCDHSRPGGQCTDNVPGSQCVGDQMEFFKGTTCAVIESPLVGGCNEHTGACCDASQPGGRCTDNVPGSQCTGDQETFFKDTPCDLIEGLGLCPEHTGACCDHAQPGGVCFENVAESVCRFGLGLEQPEFFKAVPCSFVESLDLCQEHRGACCDHGLPGGICVDGLTESECTGGGDRSSPFPLLQPEFFKDLTCSQVEANGLCEEHTGACCDASLPGGGCVDDVAGSDCVGDQVTFYKGERCADVEGKGACEEHTGACCDASQPGGVCTDEVAGSECTGDQETFFKGDTCSNVEDTGRCEEHTGACCDQSQPGGRCTDNVPGSQCVGEQMLYFKDSTCANVEANALCPEHTGACCDHAAPGGSCVDGVPESLCMGGDAVGETKVYEGSPNLPIPDCLLGACPGTVSHTITVPDSGLFTSLCVDLTIDHSWIGDLCVRLTNETNGTTVVLISRPSGDGVPNTLPCNGTGCCGCAQGNTPGGTPPVEYNNILLCDGGSSIETQCVASLTSPPSYGPHEPLATFIGKDKAGDWTITVTDNSGADFGTLIGWSLHFANPTSQPEFFKGLTCAQVEANAMCEEHTGACCDRRIADPAERCRDDVPESDCPIDDPDQVSWTKGTICADLDPSCTEHTGACCDGTTGRCLDEVPASLCPGQDDRRGNNNSACGDCGPGRHWIDTCMDQGDFLAPVVAVVGIDTDMDYMCMPNVTLMFSGEGMTQYMPPMDAEHMIPTELVSLSLHGGGGLIPLMLNAGRGMNQGPMALMPSMGMLGEDPGNPAMGHGMLDLFLEVNVAGLGFLYNLMPLRMEAPVDCLPLRAVFMQTTECVELVAINGGRGTGGGKDNHEVVARIAFVRFYTHPDQFRWEKGARCDELEPPCEEHRGACCLHAIEGGRCVDDISESECLHGKAQEHQPQFFKGLTCDDVEKMNLCEEHIGACCDHAEPGGACTENVTESFCLATAEQPDFFKGETCAAVEADDRCREHLGACCDHAQPGGVCIGFLPESVCLAQAVQPEFFKGLTCDEIEILGSCLEHTGACCDRRIPVATARCRDNVPESQCPIDDPEQVSWTKDTLCADLMPECTEHTGACCRPLAQIGSGSCEDDVPGSLCTGEFYKGETCDEVTDRICCRDSDCDDGVDCTNDECTRGNPSADARGCVFTPNHNKCTGDGIDCTNETCEPANPAHSPDGCVSRRNDLKCNDFILCTNDSCNPIHPLAEPDGCVHLENDDKCPDDGYSCTNEICDPTDERGARSTGCVSVPNDDKCPDDGIDCTNEFCRPGPVAGPTTGCVSVPNNEKCEDFNDCTEDICTTAGCLFPCADHEPPNLQCNRRYVVLNCTRPDGAVADEEDLFIKVSDNCDPDPMVSHDGPKVFPPTCGRDEPTMITVNAVDKCGNPAPPCEIRVFVAGAMCCPGTIDTDLTLLPVPADLRQENDGPPITKAKFDVWNEDERRFSGTERCIGCWDQTYLGWYESPNHFRLPVIHTDKGKARVDGEQSAICEGSTAMPLLAVAVKEIRFPLRWHKEDVVRSAIVPRGLGEESAAIRFDLVPTPDEALLKLETKPRAGSFVPGAAHGINAAVPNQAPGLVDAATLSDVSTTPPVIAGVGSNRASITIKGSVLYFPNVEVRWDRHGGLIQDTILSLVNDTPDPVWVQLYLVQGDLPLGEVCDVSCPPAPDGSCLMGCLIEREHSGWNWVDTQMELTPNQPTYWSAVTGQPAGMQPWEILDPGVPPGRPDPDLGSADDRALRGFVIAWAVDVHGRQIRWNHLTGSAAIIHYRDTTSAEYEPWAFPCVSTGPTGGPCGATPGLIELNGIDYASPPSMLVFDFYTAGSEALSNPQIP